VHLRRALLLFAVVLGLAALAASVSRSPRERGERATRAPEPAPAPQAVPGPPAARPSHLAFAAGGRPRTIRMREGRSATITVKVHEPGQVELRGLGLTAAAEPLTPARFDVFADRPGRYRVRFTPASRPEAETVGVLRVVGPPT